MEVGSQSVYFRGGGKLLTDHTSRSQVVVADLGTVPTAELEPILSRSSTGLIFIVPHPLSDLAKENVAVLESLLVQNTYPIPIYFTTLNSATTATDPHGTNVTQALRSIQSSNAIGDVITVSVVTDKQAPFAAENVKVHTATATLFGGDKTDELTKKSKKGAKQLHRTTKLAALPVIVVVASGDTFGAVPSMTAGASTGLIAVMESLRSISTSYCNGATAPMYNVVFLVSSEARVSYQGTKLWLSDLDPSLVDNVELALYLEDLVLPHQNGDGKAKMFLHASRPAKDPAAAAFYDIVKQTAAAEGISLEVVVKKINVSHHEVNWGHEPFAYRKVLSGTLTAAPSAAPQLLRGSLWDDTDKPAALADLATRVRFVSRLITNYIGAKTNATLDTKSDKLTTQLSQSRISAWSRFAHEQVRLAFGPADTMDAVFRTYEQSFKDVERSCGVKGTVEVEVRSFPIQSDMTFYGPTQVTLAVYGTKSTMFELVLTAAILGILYLMLVAVVGRADAFALVHDLLEGLHLRRKRPSKQ